MAKKKITQLEKNRSIFETDLDAKSKKLFKPLFEAHEGKWEEIKNELESIEEFDKKRIKKLDFTNKLMSWTEGNEELISTYQKKNSITSLKDIATKTKLGDLKETFKKASTAKGENQKQAFASKLTNRLFFSEPTAMLVNIIKDPKQPILNNAIGSQVATILEKSQLNLKTTSVYEVLNDETIIDEVPEETRNDVINELKVLQRITALSPSPEALQVLHQTKLNTALHISEMPEKQFKMAMSKTGLDEVSINGIYSNAVQMRIRNEQALIKFREVARPSGVNFIDKSMIVNHPDATDGPLIVIPQQAREVLEKNNLSWDMLFGDADQCECGHCNSVYSPASYFVELLQYLRNNNLEIKTDPRDISGSPLEKLFDRRPDLGCLQLTCENANTVLPYVDLVNEIMENYVAHKKLKAFNVTDEDTRELLAEPQNTDYQAYCILKHAVYPFTLPYHQPIDAIRIYLDHLKTSRYELMKVFRTPQTNGNPEIQALKELALDRAIEAEYLGMTKEEYIIITQECFEPKELIDFTEGRVHTTAEYEEKIGVKPVHEYYGFEDEATMLSDNGLRMIKKEFLRRTGIQYLDLVDLLKTQCLNPHYPQGKSKFIMESLRFSYRYLQNYAREHGLEKLAEDLPMLQNVSDFIDFILDQRNRGKNAIQCIPTDKHRPDISDKEITHWVKCHFKELGKVIVISRKLDCIDGEVLGPNGPVFYFEDCIAYNPNHGEIGEVDEKTGKLTIDDNYLDNFRNLRFIGANGTQGKLQKVDDEFFLSIYREKDDCDLDNLVLEHLDGTSLTIEEYGKFHQFIRLWRRLGWTIFELDQAIVGLTSVVDLPKEKPGNTGSLDSLCLTEEEDCESETSDTICWEKPKPHKWRIDAVLISHIAKIKEIHTLTKLELTKLLTFWSPISTQGPKSLYERLFLRFNIVGKDNVFKADDAGNYLTENKEINEHLASVMAALNVTAEEIDAVLKLADDRKLTVENLSLIYRYRMLARSLGWRVLEFLKVIDLIDEKVFISPGNTLKFIKTWKKIEAAGFTPHELNYIIQDKDYERRPFALKQRDVLTLSKAIYDGLHEINGLHGNLKLTITTENENDKIANLQDQATEELIREKASLLYDTEYVDKLIRFLNGITIYETNAPKNIDIQLQEDDVIDQKLKIKLSYSTANGWIQLTGRLSAAERTRLLTFSNDNRWSEALDRIEKQQRQAFVELFQAIVEPINQATFVDHPLFRQDDVSEPSVAAKKRLKFLELFMPYLRENLIKQLVIEKLSGLSGLESDMVDLLISSTLKQDDKSLLTIFTSLTEIELEGDWSGFLIPPSTNSYTLVIKNSNEKPEITLEGSEGEFIQQEDPTNEWWLDLGELNGGKPIALDIKGITFEDMCWKTSTGSISQIPHNVLLPNLAQDKCEPSLDLLNKNALLLNNFKLGVDEVAYITNYSEHFDGIDFNSIQLVHWKRLEAYTRLRNTLPNSDLNLLEFWEWIQNEASDERELPIKINELTNWSESVIEDTLDHLALWEKQHFFSEVSLLKIQKVILNASKTGISIDKLFKWAIPTSEFSVTRKIAESLRLAIKAKYDHNDWTEIAKPLHDQLRNNQKKALVDYLLQQQELIDWGVENSNGLFEYFLIDVEMDACMETSRIKQGISSIQLFIQRCFLGLEEQSSSINPSVLDRDRWEWMQRYRVWEANRKVFLYPENWIESNLRDDKSPFFKELEGELLQNDINEENVRGALKNYLYKVDEVANLEVVGMYIDGSKNPDDSWSPESKLHIFGRTRNAPYLFFYRYLNLEKMHWYPWEKMEVDIPSYDASYGIYKIIDSPAWDNMVKPLSKSDIEFLRKWYDRKKELLGSIQYQFEATEKPNLFELRKIALLVNSFGRSYVDIDVNDNGCFLIPVVLNERMILFFPQITRKSKPQKNDKKIKDHADERPQIPEEYYEIKLAWSELRNAKWTQKKIGKKAIYSDTIDPRHQIQFFKFVPQVNETEGTVKIYFDDNLDVQVDGGYKGIFEFDGNGLNVLDSIKSTKNMPIIDFSHHQNGHFYSWQLDQNDSRQFTNIRLIQVQNKETLIGLDGTYGLFNDTSSKFLEQSNKTKISRDFYYDLPNIDVSLGFRNEDYNELNAPNGIYLWESLFHNMVMIAGSLSESQQYEEAMKWYHFVFDPQADGNDDTRFWQFRPFREFNSENILSSIFQSLVPNERNEKVTQWRDDPFQPHLVARDRPVAYMKWVVMKYLDNLIAWGDHLFRQDTFETINQATQLYILAYSILGEKPYFIPKRGKKQSQTYLGLLDKWDAFGNAIVELEMIMPFSQQTEAIFEVSNGDIAFANVFGLSSSLYFCIPNNPKLLEYWDTLDDRLFKIRHCENIEGIFRIPKLWEDPIDPGLLVAAAAQGLSLSSVLNDLNTQIPNYRFYYILQKALELCSEIKSMGNSLLSTLEKKDGEAIAKLRAKHENSIQTLILEVRKEQLEEAEKTLESLEQNRKAPEHRMRYYLQLIGEDINQIPDFDGDFSELANAIETPIDESGLKLIKYEKEDMDKAKASSDWQIGIGMVETLASIFHAFPSMNVDGKPLGVGTTIKWGFPHLAHASSAVARGLRIHADNLSYQSSRAGKKGNFLRALQDRIFQANTAGYEIKQIDKQITAQKIRIEIAKKELNNQQKLIENAQQVEDFLRNKYTNEELYTWMKGNLKSLYYQVYDLGYELAKKAEKLFEFERGIQNANYIKVGYWNAARDGLLAGEQLYVGLKKLEAAYQNTKGHDYEITKHISLKQVNPLALIELRETGKCEFEFNETLFDMDFPGHFKRRIKSISVSIPCLVGPYVSTNATLRLLQNKIRISSLGGQPYQESQDESDDRFLSYVVPIQAIAASSGQNESGTFELNFNGERYLPFEGAGVISKWGLELPEIRQFSYDSIRDIVIHVNYTASEGGNRLKEAATEFVKNYISSNEEKARDEGIFTLIDLKNDLSTEWSVALNKPTENSLHEMSLKKIYDQIPYYVRNRDRFSVSEVQLLTDKDPTTFMIGDNQFDLSIQIGESLNSGKSKPEGKIQDWKLKIPEDAKDAEKVLMAVKLQLK